jgi:DNA-binding transcriptional ArsR family regulator
MIAATASMTECLRALSDPTRLRILGLLERDELTVGELVRALEMQQSRVSNHLRVLRDARLLRERHVGRTTYLSLQVDAEREELDLAARLWSALRSELSSLPEAAADAQRLERVLDERLRGSPEFFDRVAGQWDKIGVDFATGQARQRAAASLIANDTVLADLGCGTGYMAQALIGLCARLICVDSSQAMLDEARAKLAPLARAGKSSTALEFRRGELDRLPIADQELDGCVAAMVCHHLADLAAPLAQMQRALKPGGRAVVLELAPHREEWMQTTLGDRRLGLESRDVLSAFERAGFTDVTLESVDDRYQPKKHGASERESSEPPPSLPLYIVRGLKRTRS